MDAAATRYRVLFDPGPDFRPWPTPSGLILDTLFGPPRYPLLAKKGLSLSAVQAYLSRPAVQEHPDWYRVEIDAD